MTKNLATYRKNIYSQNGEDGVLKEIFHRLQIKQGAFVEFGAWDGIYLSNTYNLLKNQWSGIYIEGDKTKYAELSENMKLFKEKVTTINSYVEIEGSNSLDSILARTKIKQNFELLSIDIDSYDYQIWESLKLYQPLIVVIEVLSSLPPDVPQIHQNDNICSSFLSTIELGYRKQYTPICHTGNLIFAKNEIIGQLQIDAKFLKSPSKLFDYYRIKPRNLKEYFLSKRAKLIRKILIG